MDVDVVCLEIDVFVLADGRVQRPGGEGQSSSCLSNVVLASQDANGLGVSASFRATCGGVSPTFYHVQRGGGTWNGSSQHVLDGTTSSTRKTRACGWRAHEQLGMECLDIEPKHSAPHDGIVQEVERPIRRGIDEVITKQIWFGDGPHQRRACLDGFGHGRCTSRGCDHGI